MADVSAFELWQQAGGGTDAYSLERYRELLVEHGHIVPREAGDDGGLPCGWPGLPRRDFDPEDEPSQTAVLAGLIPVGEGDTPLTVDRLALMQRWAENFGLDLASSIEAALATQEAVHVAALVDRAVAEAIVPYRELLDAAREWRMTIGAGTIAAGMEVPRANRLLTAIDALAGEG